MINETWWQSETVTQPNEISQEHCYTQHHPTGEGTRHGGTAHEEKASGLREGQKVLDWTLGKIPSLKKLSSPGIAPKEMVESPALEGLKMCRCGTQGHGLVVNTGCWVNGWS